MSASVSLRFFLMGWPSPSSWLLLELPVASPGFPQHSLGRSAGSCAVVPWLLPLPHLPLLDSPLDSFCLNCWRTLCQLLDVVTEKGPHNGNCGQLLPLSNLLWAVVHMLVPLVPKTEDHSDPGCHPTTGHFLGDHPGSRLPGFCRRFQTIAATLLLSVAVKSMLQLSSYRRNSQNPHSKNSLKSMAAPYLGDAGASYTCTFQVSSCFPVQKLGWLDLS
jgi:hypothetical protein